MPRPDPDDPATWLEKKWADRRSAHALLALEPPAIDTACFHIQQAIEKMLKACIVLHRLRMPFTHDIAGLLAILPSDPVLDELAFQLSVTTDYAVSLRYPGGRTPEMNEVNESLKAMEELLLWTHRRLGLP
jgi:HEPN domain-containing protein